MNNRNFPFQELQRRSFHKSNICLLIMYIGTLDKRQTKVLLQYCLQIQSIYYKKQVAEKAMYVHYDVFSQILELV